MLSSQTALKALVELAQAAPLAALLAALRLQLVKHVGLSLFGLVMFMLYALNVFYLV